MSEDTNDLSLAKAEAFFRSAQEAARSNNFDYAIDMYLEGLRCDPDALEKGHIPLREAALLRQSKGGKKPSMREKMKHSRGKNPLEQLINAEYLLAKDPDNIHHAQAMLKAASVAGFTKTTQWMANLLFEANHSAERPSAQAYVLIKDAFSAIGQYKNALVACQLAVQLRPDDPELTDECKRLSAELTMSRGKYDQVTDFRESIKDREMQTQLHAQDGVVKSDSYRNIVLNNARKKFGKDPNLPSNIFDLAKALADLETDEAENEAMELLEKTYREKSDFSYRQRAGQININQLKRKVRQARAALEADPNDDQARTKLNELLEKFRQTELEHFRLCVENYPTDLHAKYEYGLRLVQNKQYDEAIPLFQESQRDPRRKIASMSKIGLCFFNKGWFADAVDVFTQALKKHELKDDAISKELRYNLARCYEQQNETEKALQLYRKIAQLDYSYKDVHQRVDKLRKKNG